MQWLNRIPMQFYQIFLYLLNLVSIYTRKVWEKVIVLFEFSFFD
jgi:hypothetical protein